ncbi:hypothetical protein CALCODRAFT_512571 [Calocera cornea HHB12733]|uniref:Uncharacterized protein n=1 Tax=Calocera cornea HHB12733 TaxID=1353952 RepID=A0A165CXP8_9BASI|nr:hypothetical protein CALCODRAFT_512571 [Calocera cornea HHB12733]
MPQTCLPSHSLPPLASSFPFLTSASSPSFLSPISTSFGCSSSQPLTHTPSPQALRGVNPSVEDGILRQRVQQSEATLMEATSLQTSSSRARGDQDGGVGLARVFQRLLVPRLKGDKVVVTIWYRVPKLLLGAEYCSTVIDMGPLGRDFAALLTSRSMSGAMKQDMHLKRLPSQMDHMMKIMEILGAATIEGGPLMYSMHDYSQLLAMEQERPRNATKSRLQNNIGGFMSQHSVLNALFTWDLDRSLTVIKTFDHQSTKDAQQLMRKAMWHKQAVPDSANSGTRARATRAW